MTSAKGLNAEHRVKCNAVKHLFEDWIEIHDIIPTRLTYTFTRDKYSDRLDKICVKAMDTQKTMKYEIPVNFSDHDQ